MYGCHVSNILVSGPLLQPVPGFVINLLGLLFPIEQYPCPSDSLFLLDSGQWSGFGFIWTPSFFREGLPLFPGLSLLDCLLPGIRSISHLCSESLQQAQLPHLLSDGTPFPPDLTSYPCPKDTSWQPPVAGCSSAL